MIVVHHLENSRSQRVLWLLEELSLPYRVERYARDPATGLAPRTLKSVHPLGKSPVIVADDYPLEKAARSIAFGKFLNAGQTCIAPDYVLLPAGQEQAFAQAMQAAVAQLYPTLRANPDYSAIVNQRQHQRLQAWLEQARAGGAQVIECNPAAETFEGARRCGCAPALGPSWRSR